MQTWLVYTKQLIRVCLPAGFSTHIANAFKRIPASITIDDKEFSITKAAFVQKIIISSSLKANIPEVISLTFNRELELSVEYTLI